MIVYILKGGLAEQTLRYSFFTTGLSAVFANSTFQDLDVKE